MAQRILILGGGTGGTLVANRLRRRFAPAQAEITVVDQDDVHVYQPGLLFVPFGLANADDIEPSVLGAIVYDRGAATATTLAFVHPHGATIDWVAPA